MVFQMLDLFRSFPNVFIFNLQTKENELHVLFYYKVGQVLLQSGIAFLYYKAGQVVLKSSTGITKWGSYYKYFFFFKK